MTKVIHDVSAPSRLQLLASAIIFDRAGRVLLVRENYGRRRWGLPGGVVEAGESPWQGVVRETREEACVRVRVQHLVSVYHGRGDPKQPWYLVFGFLCQLLSGGPRVPSTGEIAEVGWFHPREWPRPRTRAGPRLLADALAGIRGGFGSIRWPVPQPGGSRLSR